MPTPETTLDIICIGRASVDLYGAQIGGRLEDMGAFNKYIGGSPTNISVGCARLGLRAALITKVGDEHMGRFIRETLQKEGVDTSHVTTDKQRLTALAILGIRDADSFPLIFYRENCADMALCEDDIATAFIQSASATLVTGSHFSTNAVAAASFRAMRIARDGGRKVVFDIDYRPNLWALGGHADGENRFTESARVTAHIQSVLPHCDLIVGTEEEWRIAGGGADTLAALKTARSLTDAVMVCKRGALGCVVFAAAIDDWGDGIAAPGREVEVFNVLGAGDGFMAGFLYGWLRGRPLGTCAEAANACGALAVSRHGCAPAYPSEIELKHYLANGSAHFALRCDRALEQIHWATTRRRRPRELLAFAFDHRSWFTEQAKTHGRSDSDIGRFKSLALAAVLRLAQEYDGLGLLADDHFGRAALRAAADKNIWIGRPIEQSGVFPLAFEEGPDLGSRLGAWPANHCVKVLAPLRTDDPADIIARHETMLATLADACRQTGHELLVEIINGRDDKPAEEAQIVAWMRRLYQLGVYPDWWKLEPMNNAAFWRQAGEVVREYDPHCRGIIALGKKMPRQDLELVFAAARSEDMVRGFAIGRTIFNDAATQWFAGSVDDNAACDIMADMYRRLIEAWRGSKR